MNARRNATGHTRIADDALPRDPGLDWSDKQDFEDAACGFVARMETPTGAALARYVAK
jgi:hypothetical protein